MKTINDLSLYDLMAEDICVYMTKNEKFGFDMFVLDENGNKIICEQSIHPCACDSFATFCERYLTAYEAAKRLR